jgi:NAD+ kinase
MRPVERAAVVSRGPQDYIHDAVERLRAVAERNGVELLFDDLEAGRHGLATTEGAAPDIAVVIGGDGTMLRGLTRFLGTGVPVIGVNFGRVGFLTSMSADELEEGLTRVFTGDYRVLELPTLEVGLNGEKQVAVNDAVVACGTLGRMIELGYAIGGEDLGIQPCDGIIASTPSGSTAYNLSNGGPVLVWGLEAMVITFAAPHTLHARPLVVGPNTDLVVTNRAADVVATVLVDGRAVTDLPPGGQVLVHIGAERSLLATLPERGFFQRYSAVFGTG